MPNKRHPHAIRMGPENVRPDSLYFYLMRKWTWGLWLAAAVILLGLTLPVSFLPPGRDPVPDGQKVAHSSHCAGCHGPDPEGFAMIDQAGNDVSVQDDWQISMMGLSAYDPFWRATVAHETHAFPSQQQHIESVCLSCHAPLGHFQAGLDGVPYDYNRMLGDSLGLDGVSCSACHQQPETSLGAAFSGQFVLDTQRVLYGPYPNPFRGPMQIYVRFEPEYGEHISTSGICASCHTLITETLDPAGNPTGSYFVEQATYHEWLNSTYSTTDQTCQSCHMPRLEEPIVIASGLQALEGRAPYGLHQFQGANTAMLTMMRDFRDTLGLPIPADTNTWNESIANNRASLGRATILYATPWTTDDDTLQVDVTIVNRTGHKLPSGYPSRLLWVETILTTADGTDTLYHNGGHSADGDISGRDHPYEPHHQTIRTADQVQIYELAMGDLEANLTTKLNAAYRPLKDNRLLPIGFSTAHPAYDTVAVWGEALSDSDYVLANLAGADRFTYRIGLNGATYFARLTVRLHYQTLPPRWMADLFTADTLPEVSLFRTMYAGYNRYRETLTEVVVPDILLGSVAVREPEAQEMRVYPNPVNGRLLFLDLPDRLLNAGCSVKLVNLRGEVILRQASARQLELPSTTAPGVYYLQVWRSGELVLTRAITVL